MNRHLPFTRRLCSLGLTAAALSLTLVVGCARGPSQEEMSLLEEKRVAAEAAEKKVTELKAEKARLERKIAEKKAQKQALQEKKEAVEAAVANWQE
jgi:outer membrane murein-binding lipoprotein Lpp